MSLLANKILEASLFGTKIKRIHIQILLYVCAIGMPGWAFIAWIIAVPFATEGNWAMFNSLQVVYFLGIVPGVFILAITPAAMASNAFKRNTSSDHGNLQNEKVLKVLRDVEAFRRNLMAFVFIPLTTVACYYTVTTLL